MTIRVLLFATYADAIGSPELALELPEGSRVSDLVEHLRLLPGADRLPPAPLVAVNATYAAAGSALSPGDEVAIIPPVAGG